MTTVAARARVQSVDELEELLSEPSDHAIEALAKIPGDLMLLGVGGKMGPTLARMARRAFDKAGVRHRVIGVARFSDASLEHRLQNQEIDTIRCDLLDGDQVARLPDAASILFMTGLKFGSSGREADTWGMNCFLPAAVCQRYRKSQIVAFSSGNVYGLSPAAHGGSRETDAVNPQGEYGMSCLGRERMFEFFSRRYQIPTAILRLNYANELRYGVLVDLAQKVMTGEPIDLAMGLVNAIWQGDANAMTLAAFAHVASPPFVLNIAGPETMSVRRVAEELGRLLGKTPVFRGQESPDALLNNGQLGHRLFGYPRVTASQMIEWIADWLSRGGVTHAKPTHFEVRDGRF